MSAVPHAMLNGNGASPNGIHALPVQPPQPIVASPLAPRSSAQAEIIDLTNGSPGSDAAPVVAPSAPVVAPGSGLRVVANVVPQAGTIPTYFEPIKAATPIQPPTAPKPTPPAKPPTVAPAKRKSETPIPKAGPSGQSSAPARKPEGLARLRPYLEPEALRGTRPQALFNDLVKDIDTGKAKVQLLPAELHEVITKLYENASSSYLQIMADDEDFTEVISLWLRRFKKDPERYANSIAPLFNLLARTNMPVNYIEDYRIRTVMKDIVAKCAELGKSECPLLPANSEAKIPAIPTINAAYNKYIKFYQIFLLPANRRVLDDDSEDDMPVAKKAKPAPKPAVKLENVKIEKKKVDPARKTDQSFFSGPSAAVPRTRRPPAIDAKPAPAKPATSLLSSTMAKLQKKATTAYVPRDEQPEAATTAPKAKGPVLNKKGHFVRFVDSVPNPPRAMNDIREFTAQPWESALPFWKEGLIDGQFHGLTAHQLDMQEGSALHAEDDDEDEGMEEQMEWAEPVEYAAPNRATIPQPPLHTAEVEAETLRQNTVIATTYLADDIPFTPDESTTRISQQDTSTHMYSVIKPAHRAKAEAQSAAAANNDLSRLLSSLTNIGSLTQPTQYGYPSAPSQGNWQAGQADPAYAYQNAEHGYRGYGQHAAAGYTPNHANQHGAPGFNQNHGFAYGAQGNHFSRQDGRRRPGKKRRACLNWINNGVCKFGDACNFSHDGPPGGQ